MVEDEVYASWVPIGAPLDNVQREEPLRHFDNSVNAVSFGFVATAILISMFLIMAIFERFLRPTSPSGGRNHRDLESQMGFNAKLGHPSPKMFFLGFSFFLSLPNSCYRSNYCSKHWVHCALCNSSRNQMTVYASGVSVLMPGDDIPTFIAHPAPMPCPPARFSWPPHHHISLPNLNSNSNLSTNSSSSSLGEN